VAMKSRPDPLLCGWITIPRGAAPAGGVTGDVATHRLYPHPADHRRGSRLARPVAPVPARARARGQRLDWPVHRAVREDARALPSKSGIPASRGDSCRLQDRAIGTFFAHLAVAGANVEGFVAEAEARFLEECDYRLEAAGRLRFGEIFAGHAAITIPAVHRDLCGPRVLTSTWHDGAGLDAFLDTAAYAAERVARRARSTSSTSAHSTATDSSTPIHTRAICSLRPMAT